MRTIFLIKWCRQRRSRYAVGVLPSQSGAILVVTESLGKTNKRYKEREEEHVVNNEGCTNVVARRSRMNRRHDAKK